MPTICCILKGVLEGPQGYDLRAIGETHLAAAGPVLGSRRWMGKEEEEEKEEECECQYAMSAHCAGGS